MKKIVERQKKEYLLSGRSEVKNTWIETLLDEIGKGLRKMKKWLEK